MSVVVVEWRQYSLPPTWPRFAQGRSLHNSAGDRPNTPEVPAYRVLAALRDFPQFVAMIARRRYKWPFESTQHAWPNDRGLVLSTNITVILNLAWDPKVVTERHRRRSVAPTSLETGGGCGGLSSGVERWSYGYSPPPLHGQWPVLNITSF